MKASLKAFIVISWPILQRLFLYEAPNEGRHLKKNTNIQQQRLRKSGKCSKTAHTQSFFSTGGRLISENRKHHSFPERLIYKSLWAFVEIFLVPCTICIRKSVQFLLNKIIFELMHLENEPEIPKIHDVLI